MLPQARAVLGEVRRKRSAGASSAAQPPHTPSQSNGTGPAGMGGTAHLRHRTHAPSSGRTNTVRAEVRWELLTRLKHTFLCSVVRVLMALALELSHDLLAPRARLSHVVFSCHVLVSLAAVQLL